MFLDMCENAMMSVYVILWVQICFSILIHVWLGSVCSCMYGT